MQPWPQPSYAELPPPSEKLPVLVFDSRTKTLQEVAPGRIAAIYTCGITPYDATHIGHANTYLTFDLLNRIWRDAGKQVIFSQNITDIDDPLLERAAATGVDWRELAAGQIDLFSGDMTALRVIPPDYWITVTEAMSEIIGAVTKLLRMGAAYFIHHDYAADEFADVYFDISKDKDFGIVSGLGKAEMLALFAERGGDPERPGKRNPLDPLLWRAERLGEPWWDGGVLGRGRPGWHIGCTVIARDTLGCPYDVTGGGKDLLFPHHEMSASLARALCGVDIDQISLICACGSGPKNAISGGGALDVPLLTTKGLEAGAQHFIHAGLIAYQGEKMSKSLGNLVIVSDLLGAGVDPMAIRLALLAHHYRTDWEWTDEVLAEGQARLARWRAALDAPVTDEPDAAQQTLAEMRAALSNDLNAPKAIAAIDNYLENGNPPSKTLTAAINNLLGIKL